MRVAAPAFVARFLAGVGLALDGFRVTATIAEPSLGGDGLGDLLVEGTMPDECRAALLIEDKITAGPAVRQAERYAAFAEVLRERGYIALRTILVAPASYRGERDRFDARRAHSRRRPRSTPQQDESEWRSETPTRPRATSALLR